MSGASREGWFIFLGLPLAIGIVIGANHWTGPFIAGCVGALLLAIVVILWPEQGEFSYEIGTFLANRDDGTHHCPRCRYELVGHGARGACPGCGVGFDFTDRPSDGAPRLHPCRRCSFGIVGVGLDGLCPQCGTPVDEGAA